MRSFLILALSAACLALGYVGASLEYGRRPVTGPAASAERGAETKEAGEKPAVGPGPRGAPDLRAEVEAREQALADDTTIRSLEDRIARQQTRIQELRSQLAALGARSFESHVDQTFSLEQSRVRSEAALAEVQTRLSAALNEERRLAGRVRDLEATNMDLVELDELRVRHRRQAELVSRIQTEAAELRVGGAVSTEVRDESGKLVDAEAGDARKQVEQRLAHEEQRLAALEKEYRDALTRRDQARAELDQLRAPLSRTEAE